MHERAQTGHCAGPHHVVETTLLLYVAPCITKPCPIESKRSTAERYRYGAPKRWPFGAVHGRRTLPG
jgi:hypothetical protein